MFENDRGIGSLEMTHSVMPATPHTVRAAVSALCVCVCVCAVWARTRTRVHARGARESILFRRAPCMHAWARLLCLINT